MPRTVFSEQRRLQERMERNPTEFLMVELPSALRASAEHLATFVKCAGSDLAFIENATEGCNTVLASIRLSAGDEILVTDHGYPAIRKAAEHHQGRQRDECERGEDAAKRAYEEALQQDLPADVRTMIGKQYREVKMNHDSVRDMRNAMA